MVDDIKVNSVQIEWKGYGVTVLIACPPGEINIGVVGEQPPPPLKVVHQDDDLWTEDDEARIRNYKITPEEQAAFDAGKLFTIDRKTGKVVTPVNLYADMRNRAKTFLNVRGVRFMVETQGDRFTFHFPEMDTIDHEVLDGLRAIFGPVEFTYICGDKLHPSEDRDHAPEDQPDRS